MRGRYASGLDFATNLIKNSCKEPTIRPRLYPSKSAVCAPHILLLPVLAGRDTQVKCGSDRTDSA